MRLASWEPIFEPRVGVWGSKAAFFLALYSPCPPWEKKPILTPMRLFGVHFVGEGTGCSIPTKEGKDHGNYYNI